MSGDLFAICPSAAWIGFTATPYRGTPAGTVALREAWGEPTLVLSVPDAIEEGACMLPRFEIKPLLDDDKVKVVNGEFQIKASEKAWGSRIEDLARLVASYWTDALDTPTAVTDRA